jgi:hypothetical protein
VGPQVRLHPDRGKLRPDRGPLCPGERVRGLGVRADLDVGPT